MIKPSSRPNSDIARNRVDGDAQRDGAKPEKDVVLIHGRTEDRAGLRVVRVTEDRVELGSVRPLKTGQPISGEVVRLRPRLECPLVCDVESHFRMPERNDVLGEATGSDPEAGEGARAPSAEKATHAGPPQVATEAYRRNWDSIWSRSSGSKRFVN